MTDHPDPILMRDVSVALSHCPYSNDTRAWNQLKQHEKDLLNAVRDNVGQATLRDLDRLRDLVARTEANNE